MKTIAIVGRPNVGKSTLFNRLMRKRIAIEDSTSGTTRDRIYGEIEWTGRRFTIIDTGGVELESHDYIKSKILEQIKISIKESDLIVFVTDAVSGIIPLDEEINRILRQSGKDVIVVVNKVDNEKVGDAVYVFSKLGWNTVIGVSALHGKNISRILDVIMEKVPDTEEGPSASPDIKVAVIGKPNVGKSTFVNAVLNEQRMIVDENPGTTRDAIDVKFKRNGKLWNFIDTAGVRRRKNVRESVEFYSVRRAYGSIDRADVIVLMIDGWQGITVQDAQLLDYIVEQAKPCLISVNKWDLVKVPKREYRERIKSRLKEFWYIPAVFISAIKKENIDEVLEKVDELYKQARERIPTKSVNNVFKGMELVRPSKIYYGTQVRTNPPTFLLFVNTLPTAHNVNFIRNQIQKAFEYEVPLKIEFKARSLEKKKGLKTYRR